MEDRIIKYLIIIILLMLCYGLFRPVLIDQKNLQIIGQTLQRHEQDIGFLKQKEIK